MLVDSRQSLQKAYKYFMEYPTNKSLFAPPLLKECVLILSTGIPFVLGWSKTVAAAFNALLMMLFVM